MQVGWIGLGAIGTNMVARALGVGHRVTVHARGRGLPVVRAMGASVEADYRALAASSAVLALCLFNDDQVRSVLFGEGALAALKPGSILAIHTTGSPELAREIGAQAPAGVAVLDATFSGGPDAVLAAELTMMVGGHADALDQARPLFAAYSQRIFHFGPLGSGQIVKLLNNLLFATNFKNAADILKIGAAMGFQTSEVASVIQCCSGASFAMRSFQTGNSIPDVLARIQPYLSKDVTTVAASALSAEIDIGAFHDTIRYFAPV